VCVADRVVLANRDVPSWLATLESGYLPGALARGMTRAGLWTRHAGPDTTAVHVRWTLPHSSAFFRMRGAAAADPGVAAFWAATDVLALDRSREVYEERGSDENHDGAARTAGRRDTDVTGPADRRNTPPADVPAARRAARRHIVLLPDDVPGGAGAFAREAGHKAGSLVSAAGPDLPGTVGGAGASWDVTGVLPDPPTGARVVTLDLVADHVDPLDGPRVKRTLLLTVRQDASQEQVSRFEADVMAMPAHIPAIRSWAFSRVDQDRTPSRWTHVWEQEFADLDGLTGPYLRHPYHWTHVDAWFDGEVPGSIVQPRLAHVFRWSPVAIIGTDRAPADPPRPC
jgi:hypothetical protein